MILNPQKKHLLAILTFVRSMFSFMGGLRGKILLEGKKNHAPTPVDLNDDDGGGVYHTTKKIHRKRVLFFSLYS
jgi:hypothetical protein